MKISPHAFSRFWDAHAWVGVAAGIVLHVMFFAGGFSLFYEELCDWQEPGPAAPADAATPEQVGRLIDQVLHDNGARPEQVSVSLPDDRRRFIEIDWNESVTHQRHELRLNAATGAPAPETSHLGRTLFWLHFLYHPRVAWGMYLAGFLGVALLLAIVTGVLIHLKDLVRQFHQFRPDRTTRVFWSDLHKVLGVMGLPFQLMYAFTGTLLCLTSLALSLFTGPLFAGDRQAAEQALWGELPAAPPGATAPSSGASPAASLSFDQLLSRAVAAVPGFRPGFVRLDAASGRVTIWGERPTHLFARGDVVLRAADGAIQADLVTSPRTPSASVSRWVTGLHYAWFGGMVVKILYALLAAAGCVTILSGNWIWLARREASQRRWSAGNRLLAKLTIGVGGGVVVATAAMFWANRIAPDEVRMSVETWAFFGSWALVSALFFLRAEIRDGWIGLLRVAGAAFACVPIVGVVGRRADRHLGGVDAGLVLLGLGLLAIATTIKRRDRGTCGALSSRRPASSEREA